MCLLKVLLQLGLPAFRDNLGHTQEATQWQLGHSQEYQYGETSGNLWETKGQLSGISVAYPGFRIRTRPDPVFLPGSGSGFSPQISVSIPDPRHKNVPKVH